MTSQSDDNGHRGLHYRPDVSLSTRNLLDYLIKEHHHCYGLDRLDIGYDRTTNLRGIYAKETFQKGDFICCVPFTTLIFLDDRYFRTTEPIASTKVSFSSYQIAAKLQQMIRKPETTSRLMSLYAATIPRSSNDANFSSTPLFWTEKQIRELQAPPLVHVLLNAKKDLADFIAEKQPNCSETELRHAVWLLKSRCFNAKEMVTKSDGSKWVKTRTWMSPILDLLNHKRESNAEMVPVASELHEGLSYVLMAKRNIEKGDEITISYGSGNQASWDVFCSYGFWPEGHEENDQKAVPAIVQPDTTSTIWTTSLEDDLDELNQLSIEDDDPIKRSILTFRVRLKTAERAISKSS